MNEMNEQSEHNVQNEQCKAKAKEIGLLILRIGMGIIFVLHGWPKLTGGPDTWTALGSAFSVFGISFAPGFWGFLAMVAELVGGLALISGILFRPFLILLTITMITAAGMLLNSGAGFTKASHPITAGIVFISLLFIGSGCCAFGAKIKPFKGKWYQ